MATMTQTTPRRILTDAQAEFFWEHGYLHIPGVFSQDETIDRDVFCFDPLTIVLHFGAAVIGLY